MKIVYFYTQKAGLRVFCSLACCRVLECFVVIVRLVTLQYFPSPLIVFYISTFPPALSTIILNSGIQKMKKPPHKAATLPGDFIFFTLQSACVYNILYSKLCQAQILFLGNRQKKNRHFWRLSCLFKRRFVFQSFQVC